MYPEYTKLAVKEHIQRTRDPACAVDLPAELRKKDYNVADCESYYDYDLVGFLYAREALEAGYIDFAKEVLDVCLRR